MMLVAGCISGSDLLNPIDTSVVLLEHESRTLRVRYQDETGNPVQGTTCRFDTAGWTNGAVLQTRAAAADDEGVCSVEVQAGFMADFEVIVDSKTASNSVRIKVEVKQDGGGRVEAIVDGSAIRTDLLVELRIVDGFECADLDHLRPPALTMYAEGAMQVIPLPRGLSSTAVFVGLHADWAYSIIGRGIADAVTVAAGCRQDIRLTDEQISTRQFFPITLSLSDVDQPDL